MKKPGMIVKIICFVLTFALIVPAGAFAADPENAVLVYDGDPIAFPDWNGSGQTWVACLGSLLQDRVSDGDLSDPDELTTLHLGDIVDIKCGDESLPDGGFSYYKDYAEAGDECLVLEEEWLRYLSVGEYLLTADFERIKGVAFSLKVTAEYDPDSLHLGYLDDYCVLGEVDGIYGYGVSSKDARLALRASAGLEQLDEKQRSAADVDRNGVLEAADARSILRKSARLEDFNGIRAQVDVGEPFIVDWLGYSNGLYEWTVSVKGAAPMDIVERNLSLRFPLSLGEWKNVFIFTPRIEGTYIITLKHERMFGEPDVTDSQIVTLTAGRSVTTGEACQVGYWADYGAEMLADCYNRELAVRRDQVHFPVFLITDHDQFIGFLDDCVNKYGLYDRATPRAPAGLSELKQLYGETFFENNVIVAVYVTASSGGSRYCISDTRRDADSLLITVGLSARGMTADMSGWLFTAAFPKDDATWKTIDAVPA